MRRPGVAQAATSLFRPVVLAYATAAGVVGSVVTYVLELEALRRMATNAFSICMSFEPAFAVLWGLILGQHATPRELAGIRCVMVAAAATSHSPAVA